MNYEYKINELLPFEPVNLSVPPMGINYKTGLRQRLHPVITQSSGQLVTAKYYRVRNGDQYEDQILQVNFSWLRDSEGRLIEQRRRYRWNLIGSGDFGPHEKIDSKFYTPEQAAIADTRRRSNIIDNLISQSEAFGEQASLKIMLRHLDNYVNTYKLLDDRELIEQIKTYSGDWLSVDASLTIPSLPAGITLRNVIINELSI